jgi:hypothetical protein
LLDAGDQSAEGRECRSRRQNDAGGNFT